MEKQIKIEASGDFPFNFYIEKAIASGTEEMMTIKGVASTVNIDHDNERMSPEALKAMCEVINESSVPLRVEHQKQENAIVGVVNKAWVDARNQLWIEADLDKAHPASSILYKSLKEGVKLGLSVGGRVKHAVKEFSEAAGQMVKTFYQVALDEVSVTQRPANYDAWLLAKSIIKNKDDDTSKLYESPFYKDFLFENPSLDYMQSFAKSIKDSAWQRVEILKASDNKEDMTKEMKKGSEDSTEEEKKNMNENSEETKKAAEDSSTEEKEKSANGGDTEATEDKGKESETNKSEEAFKSYVIKGFETLTAVLTKLTKGSESAEETTIMQDKKKSTKEDETEASKSAESETETKEKASKEDSEEKESEKAYGAEYKMKSILKRMENLGSFTKSEADSDKEEAEGEDESTEKTASIDSFVEALEKSMNDIEAKMSKGGKSVLGFREHILEAIRSDSELQKSIKEMIAEPGFKKSVMMGTPYMTSKEGRRFRLTADGSASESIEKSRKDNAGKSFKDVYNTQFSTTAEARRIQE